MGLADEVREPWAFVLGGLAGGLGWAVGIPVAAAAGIGAAVYGVRVATGTIANRGRAPNAAAALEHGLDPSKVDPALIRRSLTDLVKRTHGRVPDDAASLVVSIRDSILLAISTDRRPAAIDQDDYLIRATALEYLPSALDGYLTLPDGYAERPIAAAGGQTAHQVLVDQLRVMDQRMRKVSDQRVRERSDRLMAHGRFVHDRLGASGLDVADGEAAAGEARGPSATEARSVD